jgi:radical SAM superfamily enzyme YgiQ (UPF0313 family)
MEFYSRKFGTKNITFFDDALLLKPDQHVSVILDEVIKRELNFNFHTPNGMHASQITRSLAGKMLKAGFKTIRISLETSNAARQRRIGNKITSEGLRDAIDNLKSAGYTGSDIGVYVLTGLPGQPLEEMLESVRYVHSCGAMAKLAIYSPIPGTVEWNRAVKESGFDPDADPVLHNNSIYPIRSGNMKIDDFQRVKTFALSCNADLTSV